MISLKMERRNAFDPPTDREEHARHDHHASIDSFLSSIGNSPWKNSDCEARDGQKPPSCPAHVFLPAAAHPARATGTRNCSFGAPRNTSELAGAPWRITTPVPHPWGCRCLRATAHNCHSMRLGLVSLLLGRSTSICELHD
jgi:hypothetical protein